MKSQSPPPAILRYLAEGRETRHLNQVAPRQHPEGCERMTSYIDAWEKTWDELSYVNKKKCRLDPHANHVSLKLRLLNKDQAFELEDWVKGSRNYFAASALIDRC